MNDLGNTRLRSDDVRVIEFIDLKLASDQFNMNVGTEVLFVEEASSGLSVSSNRVTLKANVFYVITAGFRLNGPASGSSMGLVIRDYTNSVNLGRDCFLISTDNPTDDGQQPTLFFVVKPTTDIDVGFRVTTVNPANQGVFAGNTYAVIHSI